MESLTINYLSDTDPDFRCLEEYLRRKKLGPLRDADLYQIHNDPQRVRSFTKAVSDQLGYGEVERLEGEPPVIIEIPTRYESVFQYRLLSSFVNQIKNVATENNIDIADFPHYSSIPTGMVDAQAIKLDCAARPFLLFDSQLLLYCHHFSNAFVSCVPAAIENENTVRYLIDRESVTSHLARSPKCVEQMVELLDLRYQEGDVAANPPIVVEETHFSLRGLVQSAMMLFVVAHEFGHVYSNHLEDLAPHLRFPIQAAGASNTSHQREYQADAIALVLTLAAQEKSGVGLGLCYVGIELFFRALELEERFVYLVEHRSMEHYEEPHSDTHPTYAERIAFLRSGLSQLFAEDGVADSAIRVATQYEQVVETLWSEVARRMVRL